MKEELQPRMKVNVVGHVGDVGSDVVGVKCSHEPGVGLNVKNSRRRGGGGAMTRGEWE